jgi:hypothetical protein
MKEKEVNFKKEFRSWKQQRKKIKKLIINQILNRIAKVI